MFEEGPEIITREDIWADVPEKDGTLVFVQRHEEYHRDGEHPQVGSLKTEAEQRAIDQTEKIFEQIIENVQAEERQDIEVLVIGSPTQYLHGGRRSLETAGAILKGVRRVLEKHNLSSSQLLNEQQRLKLAGGAVLSKSIVEPKIFEDSREFVDWLKQNYGGGDINKDFFVAFEMDEGEVKDKRLQMGAEGPREMANRLANFLYALKRFSEKYHRQYPSKRLIVWTVSHYDTISPYVKSRIGGGVDGFLGVDYGAGIGINIKPNGQTTTRINGISYPLELVKAATASSID